MRQGSGEGHDRGREAAGRQVAQSKQIYKARSLHKAGRWPQVSDLCSIKVSLWKKSVEGARGNKQVGGGEKQVGHTNKKEEGVAGREVAKRREVAQGRQAGRHVSQSWKGQWVQGK